MAEKKIEIEVVTNADVSELDDLKDSLEEAKTSAEDLGSTIDDTAESVDDIDGSNVQDTAGAFDELGESADSADSEVQELQDSLGMMEAGAAMSISSELGSLGASAENMSQEMNKASISVGQLSTQTGIAEPQMVSLVNTISNATFPQEEAMQYIQLLGQLGVSADDLGASATNMDRINDAFGIGSDKVVQLTGSMKVLGVEADNLPASFNALAYAQSNVAGGVDKFNTILQRLGPSFAEYGYNIDQASIITAAATQKWGSGRKGISELSNALKEAGGDTRALEQALDLEAGSLDNASQITGQYEGQLQSLADEEAEHKTIVDQLGAAWEDFALANAGVISPLTSVLGLIGQAGQWAVGVNGLIQLAQTTRLAAAAQWLLNIAMSANPVMILVLAIIALVAILGYLYFNNEQVRAAIDGLGQAFVQAGQIIYTTVLNFVNWVIGALQNLWNYIMTLGGLLPEQVNVTGNQIVDSIIAFLVFFATLPVQIGVILTNAIAKVLGFGDNFVQKMISSATKSVTGFIQYISQLPGKLAGELNKMIQQALDFAARLPQIVSDAAWKALTGWINITGEHSPGFMYEAFTGELKAMGDDVEPYSRLLTRNIQSMGQDMVNAYTGFGNKGVIASSGGGNDSSKQEVNVTFEGCMFDKRERVDEVLDILTNHFSWNNVTAGRTN